MEAWFLSSASREYFGAESTAFLSANKFTKIFTHWEDELLNMFFFFIRGAIKIAVSFGKF